MTAIDGELIDDGEIGNASDGIISPLGTLINGKSSKETSQNHNDVSDNGNENVGTAQACEKSKIQEQERGGDTPINISGPVDFTEDGLEGIREVLLGLLDGDFVVRHAIIDSHGIIRDGGKGRDEGSQDVEQPFLLKLGQHCNTNVLTTRGTYDRLTEGQDVKADGRQDHEDKDDPESYQHGGVVMIAMAFTDQRVRWPISPAFWYMGVLPGITVGSGAALGKLLALFLRASIASIIFEVGW